MDSELSSVEEFEDSAALVESSDQELLSDQENVAETQYDEEEDEAADDFLGEEEDEVEDDEDDYQEDEKEEEEYKPETKRITAKVHKPRKPKRQTTIKKAKDVPIPSRQSSRVRKHVDYDQTINDEEFLDDIAIQEEEEKPGPMKKRKSKIELIEDDQEEEDDDDDLDDHFDDQEDLESTGFGAEDEDDEDNNAINNDIDTDMNDVDDADDDRTDSPGYSNSETPETTIVKNQQRRSQMLENLIGLQAKRHGNRKELTEEEMQLRKAETARKRKNFIEKRLEEEKQDVLNKLLKRRATKTKSDPKSINTPASNGEDEATYSKQRRPYNTAGMTRTIINKSGITYSLP
ncbi:Ies2 [Kluyveromyces lactis]|nr:Ies2 [Kluyveromyces lactis]